VISVSGIEQHRVARGPDGGARRSMNGGIEGRVECRGRTGNGGIEGRGAKRR
jgi:hypothetical protein